MNSRIVDLPFHRINGRCDGNGNHSKDSSTSKLQFSFRPISSTELANGDYRPEWLVKRLLVARQPCIIGGPAKSLKTSLAIDLALSIGTGKSFLGHFDVYKSRSVAVISGESGQHTIQETARCVCQAKGVRLEDAANVHWQFNLPRLADPGDVERLAHGLRHEGIEVVILDPLYLALLAGEGAHGKQASNLFDMGPLLLDLSRAMQDVGCTPIFIHHTKKPSGGHGDTREPLELTDLAFAGIGEFARQWLLVNRREPFDANAGGNRLWLSAGGSCGQGGLWGVDVNQGALADDFGGRRWETAVMSAEEVRGKEREQRTAIMEARKEREATQDGTRLLTELDKQADAAGAAGVRQIREALGFNDKKMKKAIDVLIEEGHIQRCRVQRQCGTSTKAVKEVDGIRRATALQLFGTSA